MLAYLPRFHSTTTWAKFYPILTTYPLQVDKYGHSTCYLDISTVWPLVDFLMTSYLPLFVHVVIQWPQTPLPPWESDEFITENVFWANLVLCTIGKNRPWPPMEGMLLFFSVGRDSGVPNVAGFSRIGKNQRTTLIVDETNWFDIQRKDLRLEIE